MGGLEPPTSASQTRRASRLRYTPADKSIIRTMGKRQEFNKPSVNLFFKIIFPALLLFSLTACQLNFALSEDASLQPGQAQPSTSQKPAQINTPITSLSEEVANTSVEEFLSPALSEATSTPDCLQKNGKILDHSFFSEQIAEDFHFKVYLPPCYDIHLNEYYPVVYLLHGLTYNADQWVHLGIGEKMNKLITEDQIKPFIIVLPNEPRFYPPYTSVFPELITGELIPWIDTHYRSNVDRSTRAIGGISRGAAWSVHIGFTHPELFTSIGAHSLPLFETDSHRLPAWLSKIPDEEYPTVYIDIGRGDKERHSAQIFANALNENNVTHLWILNNGGHTEDYWSDHLEDYLKWYARDW